MPLFPWYILLYEFMVGLDPFADEDVVRIYEKILEAKPVFPKDLNGYCI